MNIIGTHGGAVDTAPSQSFARVAQALEIHRSIVACHAHIARGQGVHAHTAAWMLPCYRAEFHRVALALTKAEEGALRHALETMTRPSITARA
ncbi:hypothetical protein GNX71_04585 [Variovorax sp. RKNM96]|uniref:hypothetical protein n=1 Tax=Variovorax sp. RKNM96 TaxID=2681552 RepID=UPI001982100C|nr:hypothetical protein [Variovorax sp. RKNM96]QSI28894.1 hypothetical protein GNX71_04585 [Variovorax sp. RKNM96]